MKTTDPWIAATIETVDGYRRMIDAAVGQLSDEELSKRPAPEMNSVAVILRHLGGNLLSRWTDSFKTDGEKPDRNRDLEFADWPGDRASLLAHFDNGWQAMRSALCDLTSEDLAGSVNIRGESHTVPRAIQRSLTHTSYHVGQILLVARLIHQGSWRWITIPPGGSAQHNQQTWGAAVSRGIAGGPP